MDNTQTKKLFANAHTNRKVNIVLTKAETDKYGRNEEKISNKMVRKKSV